MNVMVRGIELPEELVEDVSKQDTLEVILAAQIEIASLLLSANSGKKQDKADAVSRLTGLVAALTVKFDQLFPES